MTRVRAWRSRLARRARLIAGPFVSPHSLSHSFVRTYFGLRGKSFSAREHAVPYLNPRSGETQNERAEIREHVREEIMAEKAPLDVQERLHDIETQLHSLTHKFETAVGKDVAMIHNQKEKLSQEKNKLHRDLQERQAAFQTIRTNECIRDVSIDLALQYLGHGHPEGKVSSINTRVSNLHKSIPFPPKKKSGPVAKRVRARILAVVSPHLNFWEARRFAQIYARIYRNLS